MKLKSLIAGVVGSIVISTSAFAADVIVIPPPAPPPPMVMAPAAYNWGGLYAGAGIVTAFGGGGGLGGGVLAAFGVGFNIDNGGLVFGAEGFAITNFAAAIFGAKAKVGFALGDTRRFLVYGTGGALFAAGTVVPTFGGGAAFALGERLSAFAEVDAIALGGVACCLLRAGVNFHFGN